LIKQGRFRRLAILSAIVGAVAAAAAVVAVAAVIPNSVTKIAAGEDRSAEVFAQLDPEKPKNIMLLILDGFDDQMMTAARNYLVGANGRFLMDDLPFTGDVTVHGVNPAASPPYPPNYVNDSAATAAAIATGHKTLEGRLSQGPSAGISIPGTDYPSVMLLHKAAGKKVANISTVDLTDATPAAFGSSINYRDCQGPQNMGSCPSARKVNGGKGSIAEQLVDNGIDVLFGGGRDRYLQQIDAGGTALDYATEELGYRYVSTRNEMNAIESLDDGPVLGLFSSGYMTTRFAPLIASASGSGGSTYRCTTQNRGTQPTLAEMTAKAIELVENPNGFFLMAESASVDKREHAGDICGSIGEVGEAEDALQVMLDYQEEHPDTLIVVTADHGHATQIVRNSNEAKFTGTVQTEDGRPMTIGYSVGTSAGGQWHTGTQLRVAAKGPQAANVLGTIDQTDIFHILMGLEPSSVPDPDPNPDPEPEVPKPTVKIAALKSMVKPKLKKTGVPVSVIAADTTSFRVQLFHGGIKLGDKNFAGKSSGDVTFKINKSKFKKIQVGGLRIEVHATGPGGKKTFTRSIKLTKK